MKTNHLLKRVLFLLVSCFIVNSNYVYSQVDYYNVVASDADSLFVLGSDGLIYNSTHVSEVSGQAFDGFTGMARNELTSAVYVVANSFGGGSRYLASMDLTNFMITKIGNLSDKISSIAFRSNGDLYGITGDGAANPKRLYTINKATAEMTEVANFSSTSDDDGEAIGFNPNDGFMYRMAGGSYLYKIDLNSYDITLVTDALQDDGISGHALFHNGTEFITLSSGICSMNSLGDQTNCSPIVFDGKGIIASDFVGLNDLVLGSKTLIQILDLMGRETTFKPNTPLIYVYDDGSTEKVFSVEY